MSLKMLPPMPVSGGDPVLRSLPPPPHFRGAGINQADAPVFTLPERAAESEAPATNATGVSDAQQDAKGDAKDGDRRKLRAATEQFEAFFVGYLLKEMRRGTESGDGFLAPSDGEKLFREMLDDETAHAMSQTRQMGIADLMYRQLAPALGLKDTDRESTAKGER